MLTSLRRLSAVQASKSVSKPASAIKVVPAALDPLKHTPLSAILELHSRPYSVSLHSLITVPRMQLALGDVIAMDRIREVSNQGWVLQGAPYVHGGYFRVECVVVEHCR